MFDERGATTTTNMCTRIIAIGDSRSNNEALIRDSISVDKSYRGRDS